MYALLALALLAQPKEAPRPAEPKPDPFVAEATKPDDKDTPLRKLQKERVRERAEALARMKAMIELGTGGAELFAEYAKVQSALAENLAELVEKPADKVKCYEMRLAALREYEQIVAARFKAGVVPAQSLNLARAARIDAEIDLLRAKEANKVAAGAPGTPEAVVAGAIAEMNDLSAALEKKESPEKIQAAAQKLRATTDKMKDFKLGRDEDDRLKKKYEKELGAATERLTKAAFGNPEGAKALAGVFGPPPKK